jgi:hypothetical protein
MMEKRQMRTSNLVITLTSMLALSACTANVGSSMHNDIAYQQNAIPAQSVGVTTFPQPVDPVLINEPDYQKDKTEPSPPLDTTDQQSNLGTKKRRINKEIAAVATDAAQLPANAVAPTPTAPTTTTAPIASNWKPNEILLLRGNELIAGLQKEIGHKPSAEEMQKRLQSHMGLNAEQAQGVIASLGL